MTKKERALAAIKFKTVDKIPSSYRGLPNLSARLNRHFGFDEPENLIKNYKRLIAAIGADFYASGSKICKFTPILPDTQDLSRKSLILKTMPIIISLAQIQSLEKAGKVT